MHINYKATIWFKIPIEQKEVLNECIDILSNGGTINDLYSQIDENDIGPCEILYDTEERISPQENQENPTIEVHMDSDIIWQNFDYNAEISPKDTREGPYIREYKQYIQDNNLIDDSHQTTEQEAKEFLEAIEDIYRPKT